MSALFNYFPFTEQFVAIVATGLVAAGSALFVGRYLARPGRRGEGAESDDTKADFALPGINKERRHAPRRRGSCVVAHLADDSDMAPTEVWVIDRSLGGLCLLSEVPVEVGSQLRVRPYAPSGSALWTSVRVCSCLRERDGWMVHCQFIKVPPMNVLLLFG